MYLSFYLLQTHTKPMFEALKKKFRAAKKTSLIEKELRGWHDRSVSEAYQKRIISHCNPLSRFGCKCFSQADEDGITLEILRRLGFLGRTGRFVEFGVGGGLENNTLILLALGWSGLWVGGGDLTVNISESQRLRYVKRWVTRANVLDSLRLGGVEADTPINLVSFDLDFNDYHLIEELLNNSLHPEVWIVEYNAKFPPPVPFVINYDEGGEFGGTDYFGASLTSFNNLFTRFGYKLVACNAGTGANAFFVKSEFAALFADVPSDLLGIYSPPHYFTFRQFGHRVDRRTVERVISD